MEAHVIGFNMWVKAVEKAGTTDPSKVIDAMIGVAVPNLSGGFSAMMPNHHITKPVLIGEIQADGQFNIVSQTPGPVVARSGRRISKGRKDLIADWRAPMSCGNFNVKTGKCGGAARAVAADALHGRAVRAGPRPVVRFAMHGPHHALIVASRCSSLSGAAPALALTPALDGRSAVAENFDGYRGAASRRSPSPASRRAAAPCSTRSRRPAACTRPGDRRCSSRTPPAR